MLNILSQVCNRIKFNHVSPCLASNKKWINSRCCRDSSLEEGGAAACKSISEELCEPPRFSGVCWSMENPASSPVGFTTSRIYSGSGNLQTHSQQIFGKIAFAKRQNDTENTTVKQLKRCNMKWLIFCWMSCCFLVQCLEVCSHMDMLDSYTLLPP